MMLAMLPFLAAVSTPELPPEVANGRAPGPGQLSGMHFGDLLIVLIVAILLMTALICWAVFLRKPRSEQGRTRIHKSRPTEEVTEDGTIRKRKRRKERRRDHRTRNPTLSETGGLPPPRTEPPNPHI